MIDAARTDPQIARAPVLSPPGLNRDQVGNIHDWITRWGGAHPQFVVLDADSLMEAATIAELARRMEADPRCRPPDPDRAAPGQWAHRVARLQQFAARVWALLARGLGVWFGNAGNYWGHNAIIQHRGLRPFRRPADPAGGASPFGGLILSHGFVRGGADPADGLVGDHGRRSRAATSERREPTIELVARDGQRWLPGQLAASRARF